MAAAGRVRLATAADLPEVARLSRQAQRSAPENDEAIVARHLSVYLSAGGRIYLYSAGGTAIDGFVLCRSIEPIFYAVDSSVIVDVIFVSPTQRRRGIGHDLMIAVADFASEVTAGYVYSTPAATDRPLHRFLASLGFAPIAGNRVVATSVLQKRLQAEHPITQAIAIRSGQRSPARTPIDELIAKRKRARNSE
jgi:GNAT superfamily N-acetyltransferase